MYFHVIGHVLSHYVEKIGFEVIEGITLAALVYLPYQYGSPKVRFAENAPPERNSLSLSIFFIYFIDSQMLSVWCHFVQKQMYYNIS